MSTVAVSLQHILLELERIDNLIQLQVMRARQLNLLDRDFQGLYIAEEEIDALLEESTGMPRWALRTFPLADDAVAAAHKQFAHNIAEEVSVGSHGEPSRLERLCQHYGLSQFELDALLICLAPEVDLRYERFYGYLQDDITKRKPSVDLILNLLCASLPEKLAARHILTADGPLLKHQILIPTSDPSHPDPPWLGQFLRVDARIADYLFETDTIDRRLQSYVQLADAWAQDDLPADDLWANEQALLERLQRLSVSAAAADERLAFYLQGPAGVGKQSMAAALARALGKRLLVVDGDQLLNAEELAFASAVTLISREAFLQDALIFWQDFDRLIDEERRAWRERLFAELEAYSSPIMLAGNITWEPPDANRRQLFVRIELPRQSFRARRSYWQLFLNGSIPMDSDIDLDALAGKFRFTAGQIRGAANTAGNLARWRDPDRGQVTMADLYAASRLQSNRKLGELARKITPHYVWDDIVLPADKVRVLREICSQLEHRARVYDEWGFGRKLALGKGLNVLFAGPSGTGKTMAADIMAGHLGLDLYKIDLSNVVSKYIGETEKNLARIFAEAETSNAILFFDEADALFGKRSEVRDSHDRYANIEISYLLQRMEEYDGMVILATNLQKNMDDAFVRRMHFTVEFPFPGVRDRRRIWAQIWPEETPRSPTLDLDFAARKFEVTGGNIRNIALAAAFLAAEDDGMVEMKHLIHATRREYQKMGKVTGEGEFGEYAAYIDRTA